MRGGGATGGGPTSIMLPRPQQSVQREIHRVVDNHVARIGVLDMSSRSSRLASRAVYEAGSLFTKACLSSDAMRHVHWEFSVVYAMSSCLFVQSCSQLCPCADVQCVSAVCVYSTEHEQPPLPCKCKGLRTHRQSINQSDAMCCAVSCQDSFIASVG